MTPPSEEFFYRKTFESCHFFPAFCTRFLSLVCILMDRIASTLYVVYRTNNIMLSLFLLFFFSSFAAPALVVRKKKWRLNLEVDPHQPTKLRNRFILDANGPVVEVIYYAYNNIILKLSIGQDFDTFLTWIVVNMIIFGKMKDDVDAFINEISDDSLSVLSYVKSQSHQDHAVNNSNSIGHSGKHLANFLYMFFFFFLLRRQFFILFLKTFFVLFFPFFLFFFNAKALSFGLTAILFYWYFLRLHLLHILTMFTKKNLPMYFHS